jgi:glutamate-1-semialdehyde 2,1-aminomutase
MDGTITTAALCGFGALGAAASAAEVKSRLALSRAKHPSLSGHARIARCIARRLPFYEYDEREIFRVDGAPDSLAAARRAELMLLAAWYRGR